MKRGAPGSGFRIGVMLRHLHEKGGIVVYTRNLLDALLALDPVNQYVLIYSRRAEAGGWAERPNVHEVVLPGLSKLLWDQVQVPLLAAQLDFDVIFQPKLSVPLLAPCPKVVAVLGAEQLAVPEVFPWWDRRYTQVMLPVYCRHADSVLVATRQGREDLRRLLRTEGAHIEAVPLAAHERFRPVSAEAARAVAARHGLPERYLLFVGGLNPLKNFSNLLRAFARLRDAVPHQLVAVGFRRWRYEDDVALVDRLGLRGRVHFTGFVPDEDLPAIYSLADLLTFPSLYEGFGIPVLEAIGCGCPVLTSRTGCSPEVAGGAALLVDPGDPVAIADGILRLLRQPALRERLRERGLDRARHFSWQKTARATLALLERVAASRSPSRPHPGLTARAG
jgi:glycosyltransferase involved in cell wall biosynthesis